MKFKRREYLGTKEGNVQTYLTAERRRHQRIALDTGFCLQAVVGDPNVSSGSPGVRSDESPEFPIEFRF